MRYPPARRLDLVEELHGFRVADPYRWLEDAEADEPVEERAVVAQAPTRRQPQKPRPTQQRRKPSGRQQSRPAKRRRR
jgi:protease II